YHTSVLTGHGWVTELLNGRPGRIQTELGVNKRVFLKLINLLETNGYTDSKSVSIEEQLSIFLYV
ncbi:hypothetical protein SERLA73DRAFT_17447, partial [Serpula lacrymans var. lacrymans S7.3]